MTDPYQDLDYRQLRPEVYAALKECAAERAAELRTAAIRAFVKRLFYRRRRTSTVCVSRPTKVAQAC